MVFTLLGTRLEPRVCRVSQSAALGRLGSRPATLVRSVASDR